jgi:hypothetical protein
VINGGLIAYISVCGAEKGTRHVGEVMAKIHENLKSGQLPDRRADLASSRIRQPRSPTRS